MMRDRATIAIVPIFDPRHGLAGGEILRLDAAAELRRGEPHIVAERGETERFRLRRRGGGHEISPINRENRPVAFAERALRIVPTMPVVAARNSLRRSTGPYLL